MNFEKVYLDELYSRDVEAAKSFYTFEKDKIAVKNVLKTKYGKLVDKLIPELIFQIEEQGNVVLTLIHRESNAKLYAIVPYDYFREIKREIKKIGFIVKRSNG